MKNKFKRLWAALRNPEKLFRYARWLLGQTKPFLPSLCLLLAVDAAAVLIGFGSSFISKNVVDSASAGMEFLPALALMIALSALSLLISAVTGIFSTLIGERFSFGIRLKVFDRILESEYLGLARYHSGDLLTRLTSDVDTIASGISSALPSLVMIGVRLIAAFVILYSYSPFLALSALVLGPAGLLISILTGERLKNLSAEVKSSESAYRSFIQENLANITVVKTFLMEKECKERLTALRNRTLNAVLRRNRLGVLMNLLIRALFSLGYFLSFGYCVYGLFHGTLTYGAMTLFLSLFSQIQQPIMSLSHLIPQFIGVLASAGRVMEIEDIPADFHAGFSDPASEVGLRFSRVDFAYQNEPILKNISFTALPGQLIGIMGPSGAGKTTLIRLALSLVSPDQGKVEYLYGDTAEPASADSRRHIAYVPQGNSLLSGTIQENLRFGNPQATEEEMWLSLQQAAADFVHALPDGLNTQLGERASGLSEGQAQRIAIARALLRRAPVLILDEATSALDADAEEKVLSSLSAPPLGYKPLCLIITHRRSMIPYFDRLIEISDSGEATFTPNPAGRPKA